MRKLYRSKSNRWLAGVCGGLGEYFGIDPIIFRIIFFLTTSFGSVLVYILFWIFVPYNPSQKFGPTGSAVKTILIIIAASILLAFTYSFMKNFFGFKL